MPECMARVSTSVSTWSRTSTVLVVGRSMRMPSATSSAWSSDTLGPRTTTYSSERLRSQALNASVLSTL